MSIKRQQKKTGLDVTQIRQEFVPNRFRLFSRVEADTLALLNAFFSVFSGFLAASKIVF
jgi:hypothetical protein